MIDIKSVIAESLQNLDEGLGWRDIQGKDITVTVKNDKGSQDKAVYVTVGGKQSLWSSGLDADDVKELVADFEKQAKSVKLDEAMAISGVSKKKIELNKDRFGKVALGSDGKEKPNSIVFTKEGGVAYINNGSVIIEIPDIMDRGGIGIELSATEFKTLKKIL